jgi:hypothetical protein
MAVIKGATAPTKGNPRPIAKPVASMAKPPTAKPLVPAAKPLAVKPAAPVAKPVMPAAAPVYGSAGGGNANKYRPIAAPPQYLKPGAQMPLTRTQASSALNPNLSGMQPPARPAPVSMQQVQALLAAMNQSVSNTGVGIGNNAMNSAWQGVKEMGELGPTEVNPFKR